MNILIVGATGLVGSKLCIELVRRGHSIVVASRHPEQTLKKIPAPHQAIGWPLQAWPDEQKALDAVINLAGENIASGRWSERKKASILSSRTTAVDRVRTLLSSLASPPKVWINASATGYYGDSKATSLDESAPCGTGFLAETCQKWEDAVNEQDDGGIRKVLIRIGLVLSREGGALQKMLPAFQNHVGGPLGSGRQGMSWIHEQDLISAICFALEQESISGPVNGVAPNSVSNKVFTKTLGHVLKTFACIPAPSFVLNALLGEMAMLLLTGQHVTPKVLLDAGFQFKFPELKDALLDLCGTPHSPPHLKTSSQWLPQPVEELYPFFCDEKNLEAITPQQLQFKVLGKTTDSIQNGTRIHYKLKLHGIVPLKWETLILDWDPPHKFVDTQLSGPYHTWHHTHSFEPLGGGTLMTDRVKYQLNFGILGRLIQLIYVQWDVNKIFRHRFDVIQERFGTAKS